MKIAGREPKNRNKIAKRKNLKSPHIADRFL